MGSELPLVIREAIETHGGAERWKAIEELDVALSASGLLFALKRVPPIDDVRLRISTRHPYVAFRDFPALGKTSEFMGDEEVRIVDGEGKILDSRVRPRTSFRRPGRRVFWDTLDLVYFAGYALWNYFSTPFLFLRKGFRFEVLASDDERKWTRVRASFPEEIPTHSREQIFWFDSERVHRRLEYTAEVVGPWARAAHDCDDHRWWDGLLVPATRRVHPVFLGVPLPFPGLVGIDVHAVRAVEARIRGSDSP